MCAECVGLFFLFSHNLVYSFFIYRRSESRFQQRFTFLPSRKTLRVISKMTTTESPTARKDSNVNELAHPVPATKRRHRPYFCSNLWTRQHLLLHLLHLLRPPWRQRRTVTAAAATAELVSHLVQPPKASNPDNVVPNLLLV